MQWQIARESADDADMYSRYAGNPNSNHLELVVNGNTVTTVAFERTGRGWGWRTRWSGNSVVISARASLAPQQAACGMGRSTEPRAGFPNRAHCRAWEARETLRWPQTRSRTPGCVGFNCVPIQPRTPPL